MRVEQDSCVAVHLESFNPTAALILFDLLALKDEPLNELRTNLEVNDDALLIAALDAVPTVSRGPVSSSFLSTLCYCAHCVRSASSQFVLLCFSTSCPAARPNRRCTDCHGAPKAIYREKERCTCCRPCSSPGWSSRTRFRPCVFGSPHPS